MNPLRRARPALLALALPAALACAGCASKYGYYNDYGPRPMHVVVDQEGEPRPIARADLTVVGVRRAEDGHPEEVHARLRLESRCEDPIELAPDRFELLSAELREFGPGRLEPTAPLVLQSGERRTWDLYFPYAPGDDGDDHDWSGLQLTFAVRRGDVLVRVTTHFERMYDRWHDRYYHDPFIRPPYWRIGFGAGYYCR